MQRYRSHWRVEGQPACDSYRGPGDKRQLEPLFADNPNEVTCKGCQKWLDQDMYKDLGIKMPAVSVA